jgi:hypothetical protein
VGEKSPIFALNSHRHIQISPIIRGFEFREGQAVSSARALVAGSPLFRCLRTMHIAMRERRARGDEFRRGRGQRFTNAPGEEHE